MRFDGSVVLLVQGNAFGQARRAFEVGMLFRRKSSTAVAPAPAVAPMAYERSPTCGASGGSCGRKKHEFSGSRFSPAAWPFSIVNAITPRYQSESRLLLEARENVFLRAEADKTGERATIDPEAVTSQTSARALARSRARSDQEGKARRQSGIRSEHGAARGIAGNPRKARHRPRSEHDVAGGADARGLSTTVSMSMRSKNRA